MEQENTHPGFFEFEKHMGVDEFGHAYITIEGLERLRNYIDFTMTLLKKENFPTNWELGWQFIDVIRKTMRKTMEN